MDDEQDHDGTEINWEQMEMVTQIDFGYTGKKEPSPWKCHVFKYMIYTPAKDGEPCWFHRIMQKWILGFIWTKGTRS